MLFTLHKKDQSKCKCLRLLSTWIKIHQILFIFGTRNWFFFKFCITLKCHETQLLCTFSEKFYILPAKGAIKVQICWNFTWALKSLNLMGSFYPNYIAKVSAKKIQKSYLSSHLRVMQILKKKIELLFHIYMTWGISLIFTQLLKSLKISLRWALFVQSIRGLS